MSAPFHCQINAASTEIMKEALERINFNSPLFHIVSNTTALPEKETSKLKKNLIDQVTGTVRWRETMNLANKLGAK